MSDNFDDTIDEGGEDATHETPATPSWATGTSAEAAYDGVLDPTHRIRFLTTQGLRDCPVEDGQPMTLAAALTATGLTYNNASVFEQDGVAIALDTMLQPGATIIAIASVKGG